MNCAQLNTSILLLLLIDVKQRLQSFILSIQKTINTIILTLTEIFVISLAGNFSHFWTELAAQKRFACLFQIIFFFLSIVIWTHNVLHRTHIKTNKIHSHYICAWKTHTSQINCTNKLYDFSLLFYKPIRTACHDGAVGLWTDTYAGT